VRVLVLTWVLVVGAALAAGYGVAQAASRALSAQAVVAATVKVPPGEDHQCIVGAPPKVGSAGGSGGGSTAGLDWSALRNPVLSSPTHGYKDQALQWSGGRWHMLFSDMTATSTASGVEFDVAQATSPNLVTWSAPTVIARNAASPDIVREPTGQFVVTYQTQGAHSQLEYRVSASPTLRHWSSARALGHGLAARMIDGALAFTGDGVILGFKAGTTTQHFEIAWAPSLNGHFHVIGRPDITYFNDTVENYEFLTIHGVWHLVATSNTLDEPLIYTIGPGNPSHAATWLGWRNGHQLMIPAQTFNSGTGIPSVDYETANSAFLCVGPGGENYLTYAGSTELTSFGGWGHAAIGIARSRGLTGWQVPVVASEPVNSVGTAPAGAASAAAESVAAEPAPG
jgi:hypothetical protein